MTPHSPTVEAADLKSVKREFESRCGEIGYVIPKKDFRRLRAYERCKIKAPTKWTPKRIAHCVRKAQSLKKHEFYDSELDRKIEERRYNYIPRPKLQPVKIGFPFFQSDDDLYNFIITLIGDRMASWDTKAEVAQEIALAILSGNYSREQMALEVDEFISKKFRKFAIGVNHCLVSLDARLDEDGELTEHDVFSIKENMTEFVGGRNYETQSSGYFESVERHGVCARY